MLISRSIFYAVMLLFISFSVAYAEEISDYEKIAAYIKNNEWKPAYFAIKDLEDVSAADKNGETLAHWAACKNMKNVLELLYKKGADMNAVNKQGVTPLHWAALFGNDDAVRTLIFKTGADIYVTEQKLGATPLHLAAYSQSVPAMTNILNFASRDQDKFKDYINKTDKNGMSALMMGVWPYGADVKILLKLIDAGADMSIHDKSGDTALHLAVKGAWSKHYSGRDSSYSKVLLAAGMNPNVKNGLGVAPLHLAAESGNEVIVTALASSGADLDITDNSGMTPLHYAAKAEREDVLVFLLEKGAGVSKDRAGRVFTDYIGDSALKEKMLKITAGKDEK